MGFHDQIAKRARLDGQTAAEYRHAAKKHADSMWIYLILAAIVWYFATWYWALIPAAAGAFVAIQSISSTAIATRLDKYEAG